MATLQRVLEILHSQTGPMSQEAMSQILNEKQGNFKTQLDRLDKKGFATRDENKDWTITDAGREELKRLQTELVNTDTGPGLEMTQEEAGLTPYAQFVNIGKAIGVSANDAFMRVIADYVWSGGDWKDPLWVAEALKGMSIRPDLAERWVNAWSTKTFVNKENMQEASRILKTEKLTTEEKKKLQEEEVRDYILDEDDNPVKIGPPPAGQLTYKDAVELSKIRAISKGKGKSGSNGASNKSAAEQITEMVAAIDSIRGSQAPPTNYMVRPGPNGWEVEAVEQGKPIVIPSPGAAENKGDTWVVENGQARKLQPGEPVVIKPPAPTNPPAQQVKYMMVDQEGKTIEVPAGQPIVIYKDRPNTVNPTAGIPITLKGGDGNPITVDYGQLQTFFQIEEWKDKRRREEDKHTGQMELISTLKDLAKKGSQALGDMVQNGGTSK